MVEHLAEITAVDPAVAGGAPDEVLGLALRGDRPEASPEICHAECLSLSEGRYSRLTAGASGP